MTEPFINVMTLLDGVSNPTRDQRLKNVWSSWYRLTYPRDRMKFVFGVPRGSAQEKIVKTFFKRKYEIMDIPFANEAPDAPSHYERFKMMGGYRDLLIKHARDTCDYGWFLDSDVMPPPETPAYFVEDAQNIVGGIVRIPDSRGGVSMGFGFFMPEHRFAAAIPPNVTLMQSGSVNTACMCLSKQVMFDDRLAFEHIVAKGELGQVMDISEDHSFCLRANLLGYKVFVDTRVKCKHLRIFGNRCVTLMP